MFSCKNNENRVVYCERTNENMWAISFPSLTPLSYNDESYFGVCGVQHIVPRMYAGLL